MLPHESLDQHLVSQELNVLGLSQSVISQLNDHNLHRIADVYDLQTAGLVLNGIDEQTAELIESVRHFV